MSRLRVITYANGRFQDMDGRVQSVRINGDIKTCFRTCEVALITISTLRDKVLTFESGKELRVLYDNKEIFRGVIFTPTVDTTGRQVLKAYDYNVYLVKNSDSVSFKNVTATTILRELCSKYGIPIGTLANTQHIIKKHIVRGKSLFDIVTIALTETRDATGNRFYIMNRDGKLNLITVKQATKLFKIENGYNLMSAKYTESIEDTRTAVKLTGGDEKKPITVQVSDEEAKAKYGTMQHFEHFSDVKKSKDLQTIAERLLEELKNAKLSFETEVLGDVDIISGISAIVDDAVTGINGAFYVEADNHTFYPSGLHTMRLILTRTLNLPRMEAT